VRCFRPGPCHGAPVPKDGYFHHEDEFFPWFAPGEALAPDAPLTKLLGVRLPVDLAYRTDLVAEHEGVDRAEVVRVAVAAYVADRAAAVLPDRADAA
jgi:hypothetical protein